MCSNSVSRILHPTFLSFFQNPNYSCYFYALLILKTFVLVSCPPPHPWVIVTFPKSLWNLLSCVCKQRGSHLAEALCNIFVITTDFFLVCDSMFIQAVPVTALALDVEVPWGDFRAAWGSSPLVTRQWIPSQYSRGCWGVFVTSWLTPVASQTGKVIPCHFSMPVFNFLIVE